MWGGGGMMCDYFSRPAYAQDAPFMLLDWIEKDEIGWDITADGYPPANQVVPYNDISPITNPWYLPNDQTLKAMKEESEEDYEELASTLINPMTFEKVAAADLFKNDPLMPLNRLEPFPDWDPPRPEPKPYHWTHDHDYFEKKTESADFVVCEGEPIVEVWNIESFPNPQTGVSDQADGMDVWNKFQVEEQGTRRTSVRAAKLKQRSQARRIATALKSVKNDKVKQKRQYKNVKPKNSVETSPSQSDIEECSSVPAKPTHTTKVAKKKTTKGRIDHSESERHRREVLRENFAALCELIPNKYLRGEKVSSQVSKQKILNGAKAYIHVLRTCKGTYKQNLLQNKYLRSRWQDRNQLRQQIEALQKCMKKK